MNQKNNAYPSFGRVLAVALAILMVNGTLKYVSGLGVNSSAEKAIQDYAYSNGFRLTDYPQEIVDLLKSNEETKEFVLNYPKNILKGGDSRIDLSEYAACTEPPPLLQWDLRWGYVSYQDSVMGLKGSAPTALSAVAIYELRDTSLHPKKIAEMAQQNGWEKNPQKLLTEGARSLGLTVTEIPKNDSTLRQAVTEGGTVICLMGGRQFSEAIVICGLDEEGHYRLHDTAVSEYNKKGYTFAELRNDIKKIWRYHADASSHS